MSNVSTQDLLTAYNVQSVQELQNGRVYLLRGSFSHIEEAKRSLQNASALSSRFEQALSEILRTSLYDNPIPGSNNRSESLLCVIAEIAKEAIGGKSI